MPKVLAWRQRIQHLKDAGFTKEQSQIVLDLLNEVSAFNYEWLAQRAQTYLDEVYSADTESLSKV